MKRKVKGVVLNEVQSNKTDAMKNTNAGNEKAGRE